MVNNLLLETVKGFVTLAKQANHNGVVAAQLKDATTAATAYSERDKFMERARNVYTVYVGMTKNDTLLTETLAATSQVQERAAQALESLQDRGQDDASATIPTDPLP